MCTNLRIDSLEIENRSFKKMPTAITNAKKRNDISNPIILLFILVMIMRMHMDFKRAHYRTLILFANLLQHTQALACLDGIPGFSQGYYFIHQGNNHAFGITGGDQCEWPHMAKNDVALNRGDITIHMQCILKSFLRMVKSMQSSRPGSLDSPVIKKEIMQQCPSDQFREPFSKPQYHCNLIGIISYRNTMVGNGRIMMVQVADYFIFPGHYNGMCHRCESEVSCQKTLFFGYG